MHILRRKNIPAALAHAALINENNGHYEQALTGYKMALAEIERRRRNSDLKYRISGKIKVLRTVIQYRKSLVTFR